MEEKSNPISEREKEIQKFWKDNRIFEKTLEATKNGPVFNFYDGPPFATGTPHYGHLVASVMKDVVPRYWTMKGYSVERKWGWDCHGLPIENIAEKELGFKNKKDIEDYGIEKFNAFCRSKVLDYVEEWKKTIGRFGRWADMENPYKTMDLQYMESVWWVFKELYDKGLVYEGYKSMHVCPRCETTLSQMEVSEGYRDVKDLSVTWKFKVVGQDDVYLLAWTTVPWSTLSTMGLAVGADHNYIKAKVGNEHVIFIKDRLEKVMAGREYEIVEEFKGDKMVGWEYEPIVDFYKDLPEVKNSKNVYHVLATDYVEVTEGTGIVTINGSYGEIDLATAQQYELPVVMDVQMNGHLADIAKDYAGMYVKAAEKKFVSDMEAKNLVWSKEEYTHSYPHCWRCDTPLLNYSTSSWFVKVTDVKDKAMKLAKDINWSPEHIKEGRFGKWLEGARDWSISRQRFWASVIPIWKCECGHMEVLGSVEDLREKSEQKITKITFVRHGESEKNVLGIESNSLDKFPLTKAGKKQAEDLAKQLRDEKFDIIISSPTLRTRETAEILSKKLGLEVVFDEAVKEYNWGEWNDKVRDEWSGYAEYRTKSRAEMFGYKFGKTGESRVEVVSRVKNFLEEINKKYSGKNVLLVSHGGINSAIHKNLTDCDVDEYWNWEAISYVTPSNFYLMENGKELDLHKDVVDNFSLVCPKCSGKMKRLPDVLDTWFDSGSMPYAQNHYPFENKEKFDKSFPAQFIAEGVDQTRAWFYYLHVISTSIKNSRAFSNVIVNGIVVANDGKKLSKKSGNYTKPEEIMDKYGADALRYYLLTSPVMQAENLTFGDNGVKEAMQKVMMLANNILNFYKLYEDADLKLPKAIEASNILDKWLLAKLNLFIQEVTKQMEAYDLPKSVRPIAEFIDEFSTWWLRRSRDRFKSDDEKDKKQALITFKYALTELSKVMAPFVPFMAEYLYGQVCAEKESVHLESWPEVEKKLIDEKLLEQMDQAKKIVEMGLSARAEKGIKIRQPLFKLTANGFNLDKDFGQIIADEVNVKVVDFAKGEVGVDLDGEITEALKLEGMIRELVRTINDMRKKQGLTVGDTINVYYQSDSDTIKAVFADEKYVSELKKSTLTSEFINEDGGEEIKVNGEEIKLKIEKISGEYEK